MEYLVKIDRSTKYVRVTIPVKVVEKTGIGDCDYAKIRIMRGKRIEVEGIDIKKIGKTRI